MRIGVVGALGYQGRKHVEELQKMGVDVVECDTRGDDQRFFLRVEDYRDLYVEDVDGVVVATPNETHSLITNYFLDREIPVLVEKPLTKEYVSAKELLKLAKHMDVALLPGSIFMFNNAIKKVGELLEGKALGDVEHITCTWQHHQNPKKEPDIVLDLGPHTYSILELWKFKLDWGKANLTKMKDHCVIFTESNRTKIEFHLSWIVGPKKREVKIVGNNGIMVLDALNQTFWLYDEDGKLVGCRSHDLFLNKTKFDLDYHKNNTLQSELIEFRKQIEGKPNFELAEQAVSFLKWKEELNCAEI